MTQNGTTPGRAAVEATALRLAPIVLVAMLLALSGCGQQGPAKTDAANTVVDTTAQLASTPAGTLLPQPATEDTSSTASAEEPVEPQKASPKATGIAALDRASAAGKHLLIVFYRNDDDSTRTMKKVVTGAAARFAKRANTIVVNVTDAAERELVAKYQVDRAPMPLALVVAPTGAVTGGFAGKVTEDQLSGAFVGPGTAACLKALQDNKLVLLCVQNTSTKSNDAALKGAREFKADVRYEKITEIVGVDPSDATESRFLGQLQIDPKTSQAVTAFLAPPGSVVAKYTGATDKNTLVAALTAATSGGSGGG